MEAEAEARSIALTHLRTERNKGEKKFSSQLCALTWMTFYIMYPCSYTYISERYAISYLRI